MNQNVKNDDKRKEDDEELTWVCTKSETLVEDEWITFRKEEYEFPDGKRFSPYYNYSRRDYVVIVAMDEYGQYLCVRQYRQGIHKVTVEFPAGGMEKGENPLETAKRELQEETGYISDEWTHLITIPSVPTLADNYAHVYLAKNCRKVTNQQLDETEFLDLRIYSENYVISSINSGEFAQPMHVMAYYMAKER